MPPVSWLVTYCGVSANQRPWQKITILKKKCNCNCKSPVFVHLQTWKKVENLLTKFTYKYGSLNQNKVMWVDELIIYTQKSNKQLHLQLKRYILSSSDLVCRHLSLFKCLWLSLTIYFRKKNELELINSYSLANCCLLLKIVNLFPLLQNHWKGRF